MFDFFFVHSYIVWYILTSNITIKFEILAYMRDYKKALDSVLSILYRNMKNITYYERLVFISRYILTDSLTALGKYQY